MIKKLFFLSCFWATSIYAHQITGKVISVTDGDTVTIIDSSNQLFKIRLAGIDAPEKKQAYGMTSKKKLSDFIYYKNVIVDYQKYDRYNRIIGKILLNNSDIGFLMIKSGMAWHYKKYQNEQSNSDRKLYSDAEIIAKSARIGLWRETQPVPPWEFRKLR